MGCCKSTMSGGDAPGAAPKPASSFAAIKDKYETIEDVQKALRGAGLESSQLMVAIDFTQSNTYTGAKSFGGRCLHDVSGEVPTPYEQVLRIIGRTLSAFDDDGQIPCYGFGCSRTKDKAVFPLGVGPCRGFDDAVSRYRAIAPTLTLSGPTSFAPAIRMAINTVKETKEYTILLIICDGQVNDVGATEAAIVEASRYPLSIVVCGVGDGPWGLMERWDDELPTRVFDNLQFVDATKLLAADSRYRDTNFAVAALQEIPEQFAAILRLRLLSKLG